MSDDPQYFGLYRATVVSTADPTGASRLLVQVPQLNGKGEFPWAMPCFPYLTQQPALEASCPAGTVSGRTKRITIRLPRTRDPVWVMFENGDPAKPVWLGSWMGV